mmetsp:Transcript_48020/g.153933  ORF Transcript_48020/g.153933 Transcript_48020/m.153933 type:complete len:358 (+) Transcript_48020:157-1230(+)
MEKIAPHTPPPPHHILLSAWLSAPEAPTAGAASSRSTMTTLMLSLLPRASAALTTTAAVILSATDLARPSPAMRRRHLRTRLHASSLVTTSHSPSLASTTNSSPPRRGVTVISGSGMMKGRRKWSPKARDMARTPMTRGPWKLRMSPPAALTRACSSGHSGLWSRERATGAPPRHSTARLSPQLATTTCVSLTRATTAVVPTVLDVSSAPSSASVLRKALARASLTPSSVMLSAWDCSAPSRLTSSWLTWNARRSLQCSAADAPPWPSYTPKKWRFCSGPPHPAAPPSAAPPPELQGEDAGEEAGLGARPTHGTTAIVSSMTLRLPQTAMVPNSGQPTSTHAFVEQVLPRGPPLLRQ